MADTAAARRDARRRRILENSQNRLQLISGKSSDESIKESKYKCPIPDQICEVSYTPVSSSSFLTSPNINNGVLPTESESFGLLSRNSDFVTAGDNELTNDFAALVSPTAEPTKTKPFWEKLIAYKYDIVLLSLIHQLLYSLSLFTCDTTYFFLPLIMYIVTKLIWIPTESKSNIANAFLLLNGVSTRQVQTIMNTMQYVGVISQDVCVYLFTTICIQSLSIALINNLVT